MAIIGIDLGTTNSLASYWKDGECHLIPNVFDEYMTPSVVGLNDCGEVIVGKLAKDRLQTHPQLTVANFKRFMGSNRTVNLDGQAFRPEELSSLILKAIKQDAEALLGEPVTEAVISVPAYFNDAQRKATKIAGQLAGFKVDRLINEPTAAAMSYGLHEADNESTFLVFDIGGGTFDVSILELFDGVMQVHSAAGDNYLGGEDFVDELLKLILKKCGLDINLLSAENLATVKRQAEECKKELSNKLMDIAEFVVDEKGYRVRVSRDEFQSACEPLLHRLKAPVERALKDADLKPTDLDALVLVGGASRMPMIRALSAKLLNKMPMMNINPDEVVALGAGILSGILKDDEGLKEIVLTDVAPYTLGIETHNHNDSGYEGNLFAPIIERNNPVPISRAKIFTTLHDGQTRIESGIFQGEARLSKDNIELGELTVSVPPAPAGEEAIEVRFTYDINGLLEVEAVVLSTKKKYRVVIEGNPGLMSQEEIDAAFESLEHLKMHPRDKLENSALLARGNRMYEEALGHKRVTIADIIGRFEAILNQQDPTQIEAARIEAGSLLDELEASPF